MPATRADRRRKRWLIGALLIAMLAVFCVAALDVHLSVTEYAISYQNLPVSFADMRLCVVADTHGTYVRDGKTPLLEALIDTKPDYILLLGDMLREQSPDFEGFAAFLQNCVAIAPTYAVSGNHDRWEHYYDRFRETVKNAGVTLLDNAECTLTRGEESIRLIGFEDISFRDCLASDYFTKRTVGRHPADDGFEILLFHRANDFDLIEPFGYDLVLSGHLHGGIVRLPRCGALFSELRGIDMRYSAGLFQKHPGGTILISTRGIGNNVWVPRIFNRPELVIISLMREGGM